MISKGRPNSLRLISMRNILKGWAILTLKAKMNCWLISLLMEN